MTGPQRSGRAPSRDGMPMLGLGTWQNADHEQCVETVRTALDIGYRHVDTAQAYGNEAAVGEGVRESDVDREEVFLATKVWIDNLARDDVLDTVRASLDKLGVGYVDLLYVHWPARTYEPEETLEAFEELREEGLVRRIGVSNFEPEHLETAMAVTGEEIFADQVEMHPLLPQAELREFCAQRGIELVAYSPLARGEVFDVPEIQEVAERHGVSEAQVSLAWLREKEVTAIPKATSEEHLRDNWGSLDVELSPEDVAAIDAIDREDRRVHPEFAPDAW